MISFAIVNWNGGEIFKECVTSIHLAMKHVSECEDYEIVIVDNSSVDLDEVWISSQTNTRLFKNKTNLLFAKATNQSVKYARGDLIFLLNNDIRLQPTTVKMLLEAYQATACDAIVPRLVYPDGRQQITLAGIPNLKDLALASLGISTLLPKLDRWINHPFDYETSQKTTLQPQFSAVFLSKAVWEKVGDLDERFPLLWNDVDWFHRFYSSGFSCYYESRAVAVHHHGMSTKKVRFRKIKMSTDSLQVFFIKSYKYGPIHRIALRILSANLLCLGYLLEVSRYLREKCTQSSYSVRKTK